MSINDYYYAEILIEENEDLSDFVGNTSKDLVDKAEMKLEVKFSKSYKKFLLKFGAGNFGSEEIFGIIKTDFENSGIPDAVWYTLKQRKDIKIPDNLVIIYFTGGEELFCLDAYKINNDGESPIVSYILGVDEKYQKYEVIAEDFGEFLLDIVKKQLGI